MKKDRKDTTKTARVSQSAGDDCYVSHLNGRDRVLVVGSLSLAKQCLEPKFMNHTPRFELAQMHIQNALDLLLKMDT